MSCHPLFELIDGRLVIEEVEQILLGAHRPLDATQRIPGYQLIDAGVRL